MAEDDGLPTNGPLGGAGPLRLCGPTVLMAWMTSGTGEGTASYLDSGTT